jgi:glycosyltransferase involved in cell wall biosynthesis
VAAGRAGGLPELVREGDNGVLFEPSDPVGMADALEALLAAPERLARLGANARASALPHDERAQSAAVAEVYRSCLR